MIQKQKNYRQAFELACQEIQSLDPAAMAARSGASYDVKNGAEELTLVFFGDPYVISFPDIRIASPKKQTISLVTRIMLLHYLMHADGTEPRGDLVPYKDIPGGMLYAGVFERRVTDPLLRVFGRIPERFLQAGLAMGGEARALGDISFSVTVLPRVPITFVFWRGDEEFPPSIQTLFDRVIGSYLSLEDIVVLGEMTSKRLIVRSSDRTP
jgi:hypothetical protein